MRDDDPAKQEEIKEETTSQVEDKVVEDTPKASTEPSTTEVKDNTPVKETDFDPEEFKKQTIRETSEEIVKKISAGLGLTQEEQDQSQSEGLVAPWEKEGRNPKSYKEVAEFSAELAEWKRQQAEKAQEEQKKQEEETQKKTTDQWNKYWDEQLDDLLSSGKLPKVEDENDKSDPGKLARNALWQKMWDVNQQRKSEGKQPVTSLKEIYYEHYEDPNAQPAGYDAPISLGRKAVSGGDSKDYSYEDIHNQPFEKILSGSR